MAGTEEEKSHRQILLRFGSFFEKALDTIEPPYMKLLALFAVVVLLALLFLAREINAALGLALLVAILVIFAVLAGTLQYAESLLEHSDREREELKGALRDAVTELLEEKQDSGGPPKVHVAYIEHNPPGNDVQGEFVRIENQGATAVELTGWILQDEAGHVFRFPILTLNAGAHVRIWTRAGVNKKSDLYWGREQAVWNRDGDCAYLRDRAGQLVDTYRY